MKNLILLLIVGLAGTCCLQAAVAQELLATPPGEEVGSGIPDLALPPMPNTAEEGEFHQMDDGSQYEEYEPVPQGESWEGGEYIEGYESYAGDEYSLFHCDEPVLESTGTWIRRGFWYAEVDAVIYNRKWNRDSIVLIQQPVGTSSSIFFNTVVSNQLLLNGSKPGAEGAPRFTLGHFLFRDHNNRDHVAEFTAFGGGQWSQSARLDANPNNSLGTTVLLVPVEISGGNTSFDGATTSNFDYNSRFNSFELNYLVKERLGKDHVEMDPSGHWVRRAGNSMSRSLLAGIRYFDINEDLLWEAADFELGATASDDVGYVRVDTDNDLIGTQLGFGWNYETARWSVGMRAKGGMFLNIIDMRTQSLIPTTEEDSLSDDSALEGDELSFVGETAFIGKWHLKPNFSLRASLEVLFVSSTALAPSQLRGTFLPTGPTQIVSADDSTFLGGSIGFEGYW